VQTLSEKALYTHAAGTRLAHDGTFIILDVINVFYGK